MNPTVEDQVTLEKFYKTQAEEMFKKRMEDIRQSGQVSTTMIGTGIKKSFVDTFSINVREWLKKELEPKRGVQRIYRRLLEKLVEAFGFDKAVLTFCAVTLEQVVNATLSKRYKETSMSYVSKCIGNSLYFDGHLEAFLKEEESYKQEKRIQSGLDDRQGLWHKEAHIRKVMKKFEYEWLPQDRKEITALGATLIDILVQSTDLLEYENSKIGTLVVATNTMIEMFNVNTDGLAQFIVNYVPTIIPPKPWTSLEDGGYYGILARHNKFIRINQLIGRTKTVKTYIKKLREVDLSEITGAVNKIQETPYKINKSVFAVVNQIMEQGGGMAGIERLDPIPEPVQRKNDNARAFTKRLIDHKKDEQIRRSKALRAIKIYTYAKEFEKYENIYFPCNIDFRGRIYPISAFNHQGDDLMKSLVSYSNPVACQNEDDIDLLAIQGCNLYGNDKIPLRERIAFIKENHEHIIKSQDNPFDYDWWLQADEPLQFLAFCYEWKKATTYLSIKGSIIGFKCSIPIAYDGTCSGLTN